MVMIELEIILVLYKKLHNHVDEEHQFTYVGNLFHGTIILR